MPKEAAHLDEEDARRLLELLQNEPAKYRAAISFDLLSGLRRGELLGLRWSDVDFENETVTIVQTSSYVPGVGIYTDTPKNKTSARPLKLSRSAFFVLRQVQEWKSNARFAGTDGRTRTGGSLPMTRARRFTPTHCQAGLGILRGGTDSRRSMCTASDILTLPC